MDFQKVLGASLTVQLINVLGDDRDPAALLVQPGLTLGNGKVPRVRLRALHQFPPVVVELPHPGRIVGKGLRSGQVLGVREEAGVREGKKRKGSRTQVGAREKGVQTEPWVTANHGKHLQAPFTLKWRQAALGGCKLGHVHCRYTQCGRHRARACTEVSVAILGLTRDLGEIRFNSPIIRQVKCNLSHLPLKKVIMNMK